MQLCKFIHRNLLFVTYCIQKCQKCCKIARDRVPSLKKVRERRSPAFPPHSTPASHALLASYKVAHRIAKCKEPHTISELIPSIAVDMGNLMIYQKVETYRKLFLLASIF